MTKIEQPIVCATAMVAQKHVLIKAKDVNIVNRVEYQNGLLCEFMGKNVTDMDRYELIEFIGMLDLTLDDVRNGRAT